MGLDMYLNAKRDFFTEYKKGKKTDSKEAKALRKMFPEMFKIGNLDYIGISFEAGYWRKANHIHRWFIENVQDNEDNCGKFDVSREDLKKLLELCKKVLKNKDKAGKLLPTQEGFFFGNTEYDKYYFQDIKDTIQIIEKCLKLPKEWDFEYQSSW